MVMFQQMGFGLGVAVLVDATLVRSVLVPATITLLGDRTWYLPRWLHWIPNVSIGEAREAPVQLDAGPGAPPEQLQFAPAVAEVQEDPAGPERDPE